MKNSICIILIALSISMSMFGNKSSKSELPEITKELTYVQTDRELYIAGETVYFKVYVINGNTGKLTDLSKMGYLILKNENNQAIAKIKYKLIKGMAYGSLYLPDTLSSGNFNLIAFTNWMKNFEENKYFEKNLIIANRFDKEFNVQVPKIQGFQTDTTKLNRWGIIGLSGSKSTFSQREEISFSLKPVKTGNVSISISEEMPEISPVENSIAKAVSLLKKDRKKLTITHFYPEIKGRFLLGRVIDAVTNKTVPECCVLLSCGDTIPNLQYCFTNYKGTFQFLLNDYYNDKELILSIKDPSAKKQLKIEISDPFDINLNPSTSKTEAYPSLKNYLFNSQDLVYINRISPNEKTEYFDKTPAYYVNCPKIFNKPINSVYTADFVPLTDFQDIAREILPNVKVRKHKDNYVVDILDQESRLYFNQKPALFLDGVMINDVNQIIKYGSDIIYKIDVLATERIFGELRFPGIIAITSKNIEIKNIVPTPTAIRVYNDSYLKYSTYIGNINKPRKNDPSPDFRQMLYWNPDIDLKANQPLELKFTTSDHVGNYVIKMEGIAEDGTPISSYVKFQVSRTAKSTPL